MATDRATPPPPMHGSRRVGRCLLYAEIARGGMATVHLGRFLGCGNFSRTVAVKALHAQFARDPEFVAMFLDEARVVARIHHPNVVPTIDLLDEAGELFIVMDYVEGITLSRLLGELTRGGQLLPPPIALRIVSGALQGLHAAHQASDERGQPLGVIHRDVSPENILVGTDGHARVIDFGVARALGKASVTRQGIIKGKPSYVAPEQVLGEPMGPHTDVYAASVVLWQALAGRKLFVGNNPAEQIYKILRDAVPPPSAIAPGISASIDRLVLRGLARRPEQRWPSAQAMAEAIETHGELASHRTVGELVRSVASRQLAQRAALVRAIETAPLPPDASPVRSVEEAPRDSLGDVDIVVERTRTIEPSRTSLTSEADARPENLSAAPSPLKARMQTLALAAAVALLVAGSVSSLRRSTEPSSATVSSDAHGDAPPESEVTGLPSTHKAQPDRAPRSTGASSSSEGTLPKGPSARPGTSAQPRNDRGSAGTRGQFLPALRKQYVPKDI